MVPRTEADDRLTEDLRRILADTLAELGVIQDQRDALTLDDVASLGEEHVTGVVSLICRSYATGAESRVTRSLRTVRSGSDSGRHCSAGLSLPFRS